MYGLGWSWTTASAYHHCPTSNIHSYTHMKWGAAERIFMNHDYTECSGEGASRDERGPDRQLRGESTYSVLADVIKHRSKQTREEMIYFSVSLYSHSPSWSEVRAGARGRNGSRGYGVLFSGFLFWLRQLLFLEMTLPMWAGSCYINWQ